MKAAIVITLVCLLCYTTSQSYHFSNGWNPGKRSSPPCSFSPYVKTMISKLLENETRRLQKCSRSVIQEPVEYFPMEKGDDIQVP
ncbi:prepro-gonadotropin-releasing hormone-like protein [Mytilus californianus]|uniref:prepro-gonadotropin-releasing hormone-like protein n=1 Tax=Mytilus californianus TaxID=6549 RepID=UPI002245A983|nr:prepro-gonadotropin-releasing hormone-like protein [Mytilus californianus]XP_052069946.1 prepro-gonadotropin-releasing hormone-like protein [Mytilus californianus]XP_052069947.1 prepro-gonadotropin-releasing hormone-like protein [Mytilus californianus]XP_052069948.1 prepro-gonadotropin-releasing hormone-like protein [Mytilus californianus]